jgi:hypothetical protein
MTDHETVILHGRKQDYVAIINMMDDDIREELHSEMRVGVGGLIAARKDLINSGARLMELVKLQDVIAGRNKTPMPGPRLTYTNG